MGPSGDKRSDYRERIRLARERVQAAEKDTARIRPQDGEETKSAQLSTAAPSGPSQQMPGPSHAPPPAPWPLASSALTSESSSNQTQASSRPPPRPYRPDQHSWFNTGTAVRADDGSQQPAQSASSRQMIVSGAQTESIYSQPEIMENYTTAGPSRSSYVSHPSHTASHHSSVSSIGDIPDFPIPQHEELYQPPSQLVPQGYPRRVSNYVPPPSASGRRGASSLYSNQHQSFVAPIPEESPQSTPRNDRFSVMAPSDHALDAVDESAERTFLEDPSDESNNNTFDPDSDVVIFSPGPVRQVSVGRTAKPSLTLVRSGSNTTRKGASPQSISESATPTAARHPTQQSNNTTPGFVPSPPSPAVPGAARLPSEHVDPRSHTSSARSVSPLTPVVERIIGGLEKGGALPQGVSAPQILEADGAPQQRQEPYAAQNGDRVSTTSLADLIRRATKVRTNLDRGKTASRLGMLDMFGRSKDKLGTYEKQDRVSMSDSMSGMIGWMPPHTQGRASQPAYTDKVLEEGGPSRHAIKKRVRKNRKKRCCGMAPWLFFVLLILIIGCIAAAIIVPVELLVVPRQKAGTGVTIANCQAMHACGNGGKSVVFNGMCSCACVGGFTGNSCSNGPPANGSCSPNSTEASKVPGNLTMGLAIPLLFPLATSQFGVNLNATALVGAFSQLDMTCDSENDLVTLNHVVESKRALDHNNSPVEPVPTPAPQQPYGNESGQRLRRDATKEVTSGGLVLDMSTSSDNATPTASGNATKTTATATSTASTSAYYNFGRVAVLFIMQQSGNLTKAQLARDKISAAFAPIFTPQTIQFDDVTIDLQHGSVIVGPLSQGSNSLGKSS